MHVLNLVTDPEARFFRQQVASLSDRGVTCDVCSPGGHAGTRPVRDALGLGVAVLSRDPLDYDLVHAHGGLAGSAALLGRGLPVVLTLWRGDRGRRARRLHGWCARHSDAVVVTTEEMATRLDRECRVVPHGVDLDTFRPIPREDARAAVGWDDRSHRVLFPYRPGRRGTAYPTAQRVVDRVREWIDPPVELHAVSDLAPGELPPYLNAADALLLTGSPSASPGGVKEAMACNVPVVARDVGDVRRQLDGVRPSPVCESESELVAALARLLEAPRRSDGRRAARQVSAAMTAECLREIYRDVVDTGSPDPPAPSTVEFPAGRRRGRSRSD